MIVGGSRHIARFQLLRQPFAAHIGGKQHDGVGEVPFLAQTVMQFPFIHDLQENIIDGRMRFLYLVKEDHRVGLLADLFTSIPPSS